MSEPHGSDDKHHYGVSRIARKREHAALAISGVEWSTYMECAIVEEPNINVERATVPEESIQHERIINLDLSRGVE